MCYRHSIAEKKGNTKRWDFWLKPTQTRLSARVETAAVCGGLDFIKTLVAILASFGKHVRYAIGQAMDLLDADKAALFTDISRDIDTWLWLVEAHLPVAK